MSIEFQRATPILRIFDENKAKDFYLGFLGFSLDWEHRFEDNAPLYMQVSRGNLVFHLSEHHGDGSPGANVFVLVTGLDEFHREISAKKYKYYRPGIEVMPWKMRAMRVIDPFGNRIGFNEEIQPGSKDNAANGGARKQARTSPAKKRK